MDGICSSFLFVLLSVCALPAQTKTSTQTSHSCIEGKKRASMRLYVWITNLGVGYLLGSLNIHHGA